jgi:2-C-methyl-D-erythritol 4-phosphate cytidylyltransferase
MRRQKIIQIRLNKYQKYTFRLSFRQPFFFSMHENTIIITAGGIGKRMGGDIPKQFLLFGESPILMQTIACFYTFDVTAQLLVTLPEEWKSYWEELCDSYQFTVPHTLISGGKERYHSIQLALQHATGKLVAVHDGVRPNVSQETIQRCFSSAKKMGSGIPVLEVTESLRELLPDGTSKSVVRSSFRTVQTPQVFEKTILEKAYQLPFHPGITDDASLVEEAGFTVSLVEGNVENIKITTRGDLTFK